MERLGFFGGCFNPVTNAHLNLIKDVIENENLNKVYFVPMGDLYKKRELLPLNTRIEMLKRAFDEDERFDILNISNIDKKTSAIDTFKIIDKMFPESERFFIMGSDNYEKILNWKSADELKKCYNYIVLDRNNGSQKEISSSLVREKIQKNESVEKFIPLQVSEYIKQKKLYKRG